MSRMKRIIAILLMFVMLLPLCFVVSASENSVDESYRQKVIALSELGLVENPDSFLQSKDGDVTKRELAVSVNGFLQLPSGDVTLSDVPENDSAYEAISACVAFGLLQASEQNFKPNQPVTSLEAAEAFANALCFEVLSEGNTKLLTAYRNKVLKSVSGNERLTKEKYISLLLDVAKMGTAEINSITMDTVVVNSGKTDTMLYKYRSIYQVEGVIEANGVTGLDTADGLQNDYIKIDGALYRVADSAMGDFIGSRVVAFVFEGTGNETVLALYENKNEKLILASEDVLSSKAYSVTYLEGNRTRTLNLSRYISVIYNGKMAGTLTAEMLQAKDGSLTFIDNDGDGTYDVAKVTKYVDYVLSGVDRTQEILYLEGGTQLDISDDAGLVKIELSGEEITKTYFYEIAMVGDVITVATSGSGKKYISIAIGFDVIEGTLTGVSDNQVKINNKTYYMTDSFWSSKQISGYYVGDSVRISLNGQGKVCKIEAGTTLGEKTGFLLDVAGNQGLSTGGKFRIFDETGKTVVIDGAERVRHNGSSQTPRALAEKLLGEGFAPQPIYYTVNAEGKLREIKTAVIGATEAAFSMDIAWSNAYYMSDNNNTFVGDTLDPDYADDFSTDYPTTRMAAGVEYSVGTGSKMIYINKRTSDGKIADKGIRWIEKKDLSEFYSKVQMYDIGENGVASLTVIEDSKEIKTDYEISSYSYFCPVINVLRGYDAETDGDALYIDIWHRGKEKRLTVDTVIVSQCLTGTDNQDDQSNVLETEINVQNFADYVKPGDVLQVVIRDDELIAFRRIFTTESKPTNAAEVDKRLLYLEDGLNEKIITYKTNVPLSAQAGVASLGRVLATQDSNSIYFKTKRNGVEVNRYRQILNPSIGMVYNMKRTRNEITVTNSSVLNMQAGGEGGSLILVHSRVGKTVEIIILEGFEN